MEDEKSFNTFGEVYEISCARYGREADLPITYFKEQLNQAIAGTMTQEAIMELRLRTYENITKNHVSENVFSQVGCAGQSADSLVAARYFWIENSVAGSSLGLMITLRVLTWDENASAGSYPRSGVQLEFLSWVGSYELGEVIGNDLATLALKASTEEVC